MRAFTFSLSLLLIAFLLGAAPALRAQAQCGVVTGVSFPVDRSVFQLVQDYAVPSPRHQGRYHTGEDYYAGPGQSFGQPVRVIADGRVTYSSPIGWGRDGGVVIVEHTMPDGTLVYSLYGHMIPTDTYPFPERYRCLRAGDVVGAIGDARPAPHIHFEIRTTGPDIPGPGYSIQPPAELGWLQPSRFILNWQTWLLSAHRWHVQLPEDNRLVTPPLILDDGSMLLASRDRLRYASADGRILWRIILDQTPVALTLVDRRPVVVYPNGNLQFINLDASLGERWSVSVPLQSPALPFADRLLFHSADDTLLALTPDRRQIAWQQSGIPPFVRAYVAPAAIGLITAGNTLYALSHEGALLATIPLDSLAFMGAAPDGRLLYYTQNGFAAIDSTGNQSQVISGLPGTPDESALVFNPLGAFYFWGGGTSRTLNAIGSDGSLLWQTPLPEVVGRAELALYDGVLLLITGQGNLVALQADTGLICNRSRFYADNHASLSYTLTPDGILRLATPDQITGLDWRTFIGACAA